MVSKSSSPKDLSFQSNPEVMFLGTALEKERISVLLQGGTPHCSYASVLETASNSEYSKDFTEGTTHRGVIRVK